MSLIGLTALLYSTRISLAGDRFPELYGDGTLRPAYQAAFAHVETTELSDINRAALQVLQRFERRAGRAP